MLKKSKYFCIIIKIMTQFDVYSQYLGDKSDRGMLKMKKASHLRL